MRVLIVIAALMLTADVAFPQSPEQGQIQKTNPQDNKPARQTQTVGETTTGRLTSADRNFVNDASEAGAAEVAHGQLAVSKASNPVVKNFAQRMVDDHSKTNQALMQLATIKGLTPQSGMTSAGHQVSEQQAQSKSKARDLNNKWSKLSGADFDREYMKAQVKDHEKAVALFEKEASSGSDPDLKSFAEKTLPTLKEHLQMAREVASRVGHSTGTAATKH